MTKEISPRPFATRRGTSTFSKTNIESGSAFCGKPSGSSDLWSSAKERYAFPKGDQMTYEPMPIDTTNVELPVAIMNLIEVLASNTHDSWAKQRIAEGWRYGPRRDDERKEHPDLVPYERLPEVEKQYDRVSAIQTLRVIIA